MSNLICATIGNLLPIKKKIDFKRGDKGEEGPASRDTKSQASEYLAGYSMACTNIRERTTEEIGLLTKVNEAA